MTFEEARAQFPVLERFAYLNAGTFGPLARATVEAMVERAAPRPRGGPRRPARTSRRCSAARSACARRSPAQVGVAAGARRAHALDDRRLHDRARRARARRRTTRSSRPTASTSACSGRCTPRARASASPRCATGPRPRRSTRSWPRSTPRTRLIALSHVVVDDRPRAAARRAEGADRAAAARRRRAVGRRDPGRRARVRLLHGLRPEVALRPGRDRRALRRATRSALARRAAELPLAGGATSRTARSRRSAGAARFDPGWIAPPSLAGLEAALGRRTRVALRARRASWPRAAASCSPSGTRSSPSRATRRSSRSAPGGDPAEAVERAHEAGVDRPRPARAPAGCAPRAATGRATTTSSASSPALARSAGARRCAARAAPRSAAAPRSRTRCARRGRPRAPRRPA